MVRTGKAYLQTALRKVGVYERLRSTYLCDLYRRAANREVFNSQRRETEFYQGLLAGFRQNDLIFDIGANRGDKTSVFLRLGARVVAVEPDELNQAVLKERFLRYRFKPKPVILVPKAVSDTSRIETMWVDEPGSALNSLSRKWVESLKIDDKRFGHCLEFARHNEVRTTTLEELSETHGSPFFVKIDVEGHELRVLRGMKHPVPYLSFEVNLPEFREEGMLCIEFLRLLDANGRFNFAIDCRDGMALADWSTPTEFSHILGECSASSIEVFWKASICSSEPML